jgi:hypothetical protein
MIPGNAKYHDVRATEQEGAMSRKSRLIFLAILMLLAWPVVCGAEVTRFWFNVWTTQMPDPANPSSILKRLDVTVAINDTRYRPPDAITSLVVTAPDGTVLNLTKNYWNELRSQFEASFVATDFTGGEIPSGTYAAKLTDKSGKPPLLATKNLTAAFLAMPVISSPTEGAVLTDLTPLIKWGLVTGAVYYTIHLTNVTLNKEEPVYLLGLRSLDIYRNQFTLQTGVLKPGMKYLMRVEARDSDRNIIRRSRSKWVSFKTSPSAQ